MSTYYNPKRTRNLFQENSKFRLSRSKIDLFIECPQCFYFDRKLGVARPPSFPFTLNSAVDQLLKKEFDIYRSQQRPHPLMQSHHINAIPYDHVNMEIWRDSLRNGITYNLPNTNLEITGGVDDIWINPEGELIIVDYKATSKESQVNLDAEWQNGYKRQMEIYQWLFRKNGFKVSKTGYFVYANADAGADAFNHTLKFEISILPYDGNDSWVENTIYEAFSCLQSEEIPKSSQNCDYCNYRNAVDEVISEPKQTSLL